MLLLYKPAIHKTVRIIAYQSRPQSPHPLDQQLGSTWALVESKTGARKSWFRFDSARASEIVVEMNKFQQPMRFGRFFWRAFSLAQRSRFPAQSRRIAGSGDEIDSIWTRLEDQVDQAQF